MLESTGRRYGQRKVTASQGPAGGPTSKHAPCMPIEKPTVRTQACGHESQVNNGGRWHITRCDSDGWPTPPDPYLWTVSLRRRFINIVKERQPARWGQVSGGAGMTNDQTSVSCLRRRLRRRGNDTIKRPRRRPNTMQWRRLPTTWSFGRTRPTNVPPYFRLRRTTIHLFGGGGGNQGRREAIFSTETAVIDTLGSSTRQHRPEGESTSQASGDHVAFHARIIAVVAMDLDNVEDSSHRFKPRAAPVPTPLTPA